MAIARIVAQRVEQSRRDAQAAAGFKLQRGGNAVHLAEFLIAAARHRADRGSESMPQRCAGQKRGRRSRPAGLSAIAGKPGHDLPHAAHPAELVGDDGGFLFIDALELTEFLGLGDNVERIFAEFSHQLFGGGRPDVGQHAAGQVA